MVSLNDDFDDFVAFAFSYGTFSHDTIPSTEPRIPKPPTDGRSAQALIEKLEAERNAGNGELPAA